MITFFLWLIVVSLITTIYMVISQICADKEEQATFERDLAKLERGERLSHYD